MSLVKEKALSWDTDNHSCTVVHPMAMFDLISTSLQLSGMNMWKGAKEEGL